MKKLFIFVLLIGIFFTTGCNKNSEKNIVDDLEKKIGKASSYKLEGVLEIVNNDESYKYDVTVMYKKPELYKVSLVNKNNAHEQIILKNNEGVYVVTPSLNKSFKFSSEWPNNNSQVYLLNSVIEDIKKDEKRNFKEEGKNYVITVKVNYPNNRRLVKEKIIVDKNLNITQIEVMDENNIPNMKMTFNKIDLKYISKEMDFKLDDIMKDKVIDNKPTSKLDDIIYPLYIPNGTKLSNQEKVEKTNGERVIMTFDGEKPFLLVEETVSSYEEFTVIPTFGEPQILIDTIGVVSDKSLSWTSGKTEYYLVSDDMSKEELLEIAKSINNIPALK
ncbi:MAG: hypothetical protein RR359_03240 [Bacilli bacterium]